MADDGKHKIKAQSPKECVAELIIGWLASDKLTQNLVIERMQLNSENIKINADNFYHWYLDTGRPVHTNPDDTLTILQAIRELKSTQKRFKAAEVIEFCDLTQFPISRFQEVQQLYGTQEWKKEWEEAIKPYIPNHSTSFGYQTESEVVPVIGEHDFPLNKEDAYLLLEEDGSDNDRWISVNDTGIPRLFERFLGRDDLLKILKDQLCGGKRTRTIALYGKPGVGKTAIAMAIANDPTVQRYFHGGILWAGLGTNPDIEGIQRRWMDLLHIHDIGAAISSQPLLLILDDVWDINHVAKFFRFGNHNPFCRYLITTVPQSLADNISENHSLEIPELTVEKGLELLQHLAPNIVQSEKKEARALIEAVGSLPLAIWLMGVHLESEANHNQPRRIHEALKSLQNYEERLYLERVPHDLKAFPSFEERSTISLKAVIGVRYEALDDNARQMLRAVSIFPPKPNTFSEDAASATAATSGKTFRDHLVDAGLVEDVGGDRYTLHQTIRDFAFSMLDKEPGENQAANERLAHFFVEYVQTRGVQSLDEANINHALKWASDHEQNELYLALASGMQYFWRDYWRVTESMEHLSKGFSTAKTMFRETKDPLSLQRMMEVACNYGSALLLANRLDEAKHAFETILEIARGEAPDRLSEGIALFNLAVVALQQGDINDARVKFGESLLIRYEEQYQDEWALDFVTFCRIAQSRSQLEILKDYFERAIEIDRVVGNRRGEGVDLFSLGNIALIQKKYQAAASKYRECLVVVNEFEEKIKEGVVPARWRETILLAKGTVLSVLCEVSLFLENLGPSEDYLQQSMKIIQALEHRREFALNLLYSGRLALARGQKEDANHYYLEGLQAAQEVQDQANVADALYNLGTLAELEGNLDLAEGFLRKSLELNKEIQNAPYIANLHFRLGQLLLNRGKNREEASSMIADAVHWYSDMGLTDDEIAKLLK
jgi:tetratricopeptide (TPR) repeat protein